MRAGCRRSAALRRLSVVVLLGSAHGYLPFAGVEDLAPRHLHEFCGPAGSSDGTRRCAHSMRTTLDDGGDVALDWALDIDPDSILSLDTEVAKGVRLKRCDPAALELELPESHAHHVVAGRFVVASKWAHQCGHLNGDHLYHRIEEVEHLSWHKPRPDSERLGHARVRTQEVPSIAHMARNVNFQFRYMPPEASDFVEEPVRRTDDGKRRLAAATTPAPSTVQTGSFGQVSSILNFIPKQIANFGWNWDAEGNFTTNPEYNYTIPGGRGSFVLRRPYVKVHAGLWLNFTSRFITLQDPPHVKFTLGMAGHGTVNAKVIAEMEVADPQNTGTVKRFQMPVLPELSDTMWLGELDFSLGSIPISFQPGVQLEANAYHKGSFRGSLEFGINTHAKVAPTMHYDSLLGIDVHAKMQLLNSKVWPPMWMIFTDHYDMGVQLAGHLWVKGRIGNVRDAKAGIAVKPYMNVTISRFGSGSSDLMMEMKQLVVYPYRVSGLSGDGTYQVSIEANGLTKTTSKQMNFGDLEFHDHASTFLFGEVPQSVVLSTPITVKLLKEVTVWNGTSMQVVGVTTVKCNTMLNGECTPSPTTATVFDGATSVFIDIVLLWMSEPLPWFASKIRGVSIDFPEVILRDDLLKQLKTDLTAQNESVTLFFERNGRGFYANMLSNLTLLKLIQDNRLKSPLSLELGNTFYQSWKPCTEQSCQTTRLSLYHGDVKLGENTMPAIPWESASHLYGARQSLRHSSGNEGVLDLPVTLALYSPTSNTQSVATAKLMFHISNPAESSFFVRPYQAENVILGNSRMLSWTVANKQPTMPLSFVLTLAKEVNGTAVSANSKVEWPSVRAKGFAPMPNPITMDAQACSKHQHSDTDLKATPCTFDHLLVFGEPNFVAGDRVVVRVEWNQQGQKHRLFSPPFKIIAAPVVARRLATEDEDEEADRRLWSANDWSSRMVSTDPDCREKKLQFSLGAGVLLSSKFAHLRVPDGLPIIGGLSEAPDLSSGDVALTGFSNKERFEDLFPPEVCSGGICRGVLPGCPPPPENATVYPDLTFDFNRPLHYSVTTQRAFKAPFAYMFSLLPSVVDLAIAALNKSAPQRPVVNLTLPIGTITPLVTMAPTVQPLITIAPSGGGDSGNEPIYQSTTTIMPTTSPPIVATTTPVVTAAPPVLAPTSRRLDEYDGTPVHSVTVRFNEGLPFKVDEKLVHELLRNGALDDLDDGLVQEQGPLKVAGFRIEHRDRTLKDMHEQGLLLQAYDLGSAHPAAESRPLPVTSSAKWLVTSLAVTGVTVSLGVAVLMRRRGKQIAGLGEHTMLPDEGEGLE